MRDRDLVHCFEDGINVHIFCEISTNYLFYVLPVKYLVEIMQNFVAFSEYINFNLKKYLLRLTHLNYNSGHLGHQGLARGLLVFLFLSSYICISFFFYVCFNEIKSKTTAVNVQTPKEALFHKQPGCFLT